MDDEDYGWLNEYKCCLNKDGYTTCSIKINGKWTTKRIHRLIMKEPIDLQIDHIDMNKLNNQKNNLRIVTKSQNMMNRRSLKNSSSKFKGVTWNKMAKKWKSSINKNKVKYHLGYFVDEIDAAVAYNRAAKELFKEYAYLNEV